MYTVSWYKKKCTVKVNLAVVPYIMHVHYDIITVVVMTVVLKGEISCNHGNV